MKIKSIIVIGLLAASAAFGQTRVRSFPTLPCSSNVGPAANELWMFYPGTQAPSKNPDTGYRINGVKVETGQLREAAGVTQIVQPKLPTPTSPENAEWVVFNPNNSNHCNTASLYNSYRENWSHGPVHGGHDDCAGYYQQVHGFQPTDMEWKDCDYNFTLFLDWKKQACLKEGGKWDEPSKTCRKDGTYCGDLKCQPEYLENALNCKVDCKTTPPPTTCTPTATKLCLQQSRFAVEVAWKDHQGNTGVGQAITQVSDTGSFWFFASTNYELMVKVLDGRSLGGYYWVFWGALSNVEYTITVTDTKKGTKKTYFNPANTQASGSDTAAFPE